MDEDAAVVQELPEGVPEMAEENVPQLAPTALVGVAVDDHTAVVQELPVKECQRCWKKCPRRQKRCGSAV